MTRSRPVLARALLSLAAWRRAQRGPLRDGWSLETETLSRVLHHYARRSTLLPLGYQRWAIGAFARPEPSAKARFQRVDADGVPGAWIQPEGTDEGRVLYYLHGGGYSIGSVASHRAFITRLARALGARAFAIDYRLAPEHPFPAQRDDARTAWLWLLRQGVRAENVLIAGESAGGGLTMSTLVALRDAGEPMPAAAAVISPWVDLTLAGGSIDENARFDYLPRHVLGEYVERMIGGHDPAHPGISPVFADLSRLPPLFIQVGASEALRDDARVLAERATAQGTSVELKEHPDMIHAFPLLLNLPESRVAIAELADFGRRHLP
jgi:epsilon-lactone hydrolase